MVVEIVLEMLVFLRIIIYYNIFGVELRVSERNKNDILPSGNLLQFAIENGPVEIVDLATKNGGSFNSELLVYISDPKSFWGFISDPFHMVVTNKIYGFLGYHMDISWRYPVK